MRNSNKTNSNGIASTSKIAVEHNICDFSEGQDYEMVLQDQSVLDGIDD